MSRNADIIKTAETIQVQREIEHQLASLSLNQLKVVRDSVFVVQYPEDSGVLYGEDVPENVQQNLIEAVKNALVARNANG